MTSYIIIQRADGRGELKPYKNFLPEEAGSKISIGDKLYSISSAGRSFIGKSVMEEYGVMGNDGRKRIQIEYGYGSRIAGERKASGYVFTPVEGLKNADAGWVDEEEHPRDYEEEEGLTPDEEQEYYPTV